MKFSRDLCFIKLLLKPEVPRLSYVSPPWLEDCVDLILLESKPRKRKKGGKEERKKGREKERKKERKKNTTKQI